MGGNVHHRYSHNSWLKSITIRWLRPTTFFVWWITWNRFVQMLTPVSIKFTPLSVPSRLFIWYFNRIARGFWSILIILQRHELTHNYPTDTLLNTNSLINHSLMMGKLQTCIKWRKKRFQHWLYLNTPTLKYTGSCGPIFEKNLVSVYN